MVARLVCYALALGLAGSVAFAEPAERDRQTRRGPGSVTVIGNNAAKERCAQSARSGQTDQRGIDACSEALSARITNRERADILVNRGVLNLRRRDFPAAIADFDSATAIAPEHGDALLNKGIAQVQTRDYGTAVATLTRALGIGVSQPHLAYFNRGVAREGLQDIQGAYEDYSTSLEIQPDWGVAEAELARFARGRRDVLAAQLASESDLRGEFSN